jgi:hypothetical protein
MHLKIVRQPFDSQLLQRIFKRTMIKKLLLRTFLIGGLVLGQLSFLIWLINYLHLNPTSNAQQENLINNAQAEPQLLAYAAPLATQPAAPKKAPSYQRTGVSSLQIKTLDNSRLLLNFPNEDFQINEEERDLLEAQLANLQINRGHTVRLYVETTSATPEENLITRPVPKLRAQSIARVIYAYTQKVEIIFTSQQIQAGSLIIDASSPA